MGGNENVLVGVFVDVRECIYSQPLPQNIRVRESRERRVRESREQRKQRVGGEEDQSQSLSPVLPIPIHLLFCINNH